MLSSETSYIDTILRLSIYTILPRFLNLNSPIIILRLDNLLALLRPPRKLFHLAIFCSNLINGKVCFGFFSLLPIVIHHNIDLGTFSFCSPPDSSEVVQTIVTGSLLAYAQ